MLPFFRKLRRQFANEGQVFKYSRYALGEILLIVIGILLALQINNWNEEKQSRREECLYLESLLSDMERQGIEIDAQMQSEHEVVRHGERLIEEFNRNEGFIIDSAFSMNLSILNNRRTFKRTDAAYTDLLSSGKLSYLSNDSLKVHILRYFEGLENASNVLDRNNQIIDMQFAPIALGMATHHIPYSQQGFLKVVKEAGLIDREYYPVLGNEAEVLGHLQVSANRVDQQLRLINEIQYRYRISLVHLYFMQLLKVQTETLKNSLQGALQNCE